MSIPAIHPATKADPQWLSRLTAVVNALVGKANCTADLTLTPSVTSTDMIDTRLSAVSALTFMPRTASAATAHAGIYVTDQRQGYAKINHASAAAINQTFRVAIHG